MPNRSIVLRNDGCVVFRRLPEVALLLLLAKRCQLRCLRRTLLGKICCCCRLCSLLGPLLLLPLCLLPLGTAASSRPLAAAGSGDGTAAGSTTSL